MVNISDKLPKKPGAKYRSRDLSQVRQVVVHHTAGPDTQTPEQIAVYHTSPNHICADGCPGIAYHFIITADSIVYQVNPLEAISYHVSGNNTSSIGVCFIGNYEVNEPTEAQINSFKWLMEHIYAELGRTVPIRKHSEFKATACPGQYLAARLDELQLA